MKTVAVSVPIAVPSDSGESSYAKLKYKTSSETLQVTSIAIPRRITHTAGTKVQPPVIPAGVIVEVKAIVQGPQDDLPRSFTVACFPLSSSFAASTSSKSGARIGAEEHNATLQTPTENLVFLTDLRFVMESVHFSATLLAPSGTPDAVLKATQQEWSSVTVFGTATPLV